MISIEAAAALALALPDVVEGEYHGHRTWNVGGRSFAWERPFSKADIKRFGDNGPPDGPILAVRLADLGDKEAVLRDLLIDGCLAHAPAELSSRHTVSSLRRALRS